jgi:aspartyl protease family protein
MLYWLVLVLLALGGAFFLLRGGGGGGAFGVDGAESTGLVLGAVLMTAYVIFLLGGYRGRFAQAAKYLAIWLIIALALVTAYAYRGEFWTVAHRVAGELLPPGQGMAVETGDAGERAVRVRRRPDGHFMVRADVNGANVSLLVDTGASTVVLRPADAERAGIDTGSLAFAVPVQTANGTAYAAPVRLRTISVGGIEVRDIEALVAKPGTLKESLLGMSFLRRLRSYEFSGEFRTLRS